MSHLGRRHEYETAGIDVPDLDPDPIAQLRRWYEDAVDAGLREPEAMLLATASADGVPAARYVLMRGLDARGITFFSNYESAKGRDLAANPAVAATFGWLDLHRQVRVSGTAERLPEAESDAYFGARSRGSRIGAWASPQSDVLSSREELDARIAEAEARFPGDDVPRPPHWGGILVRPHAVEFWQGRTSRLHDRLRYRREGDAWVIERLAP